MASLSHSPTSAARPTPGTLLPFLLLVSIATCPETTSGDWSEESEEYGYVTFVSETDIYYEDDDHPGDPALDMDKERCPPLPDPALANEKLCRAKPCLGDDQCNNTLLKSVCCFNGCLFSCLPEIPPPPVFDWLEERSLKSDLRHEHFHEFSSEESGMRTRVLSVRGTTGDVSLRGGCLLTQQQYDHLLLFRKHKHVNSCSCLKKEVVCSVNEDV